MLKLAGKTRWVLLAVAGVLVIVGAVALTLRAPHA